MTAPRPVVLVEANEDDSVGGSHRALAWMVPHLDRARFDPLVVFYQDNPVAEELRAAGVAVEAWDTQRAKERSLRRNRLSALLAQPRLLAARHRFIRDRRPALVHINNSPFAGFDDWLPACRLSGIPCLAHARGAWRTPPGLGRRLLSPRFDRVIAVSRHVAESWARFGVPAQRLRVVPDGIDLDAFRARLLRTPGEVRAELGVPADGLLVLLPGTLLRWKGQDVALEALARIEPGLRSRTVLALAGGASASEGPEYRARLQSIVVEKGLGPSVRFLGHRSDVPDLMRAADLVLHASTEPEPFGLVLLEAMALGRPLVASSLGGPAEVVTPAAGRLFDPGHPEILAAELTALLADAALRERLGQAGMELVETYSVANTAHGVERVYDEVLQSARAS
ncbi:MAG: glycosyltransferase [Gemmatimonadales bacterium]